MGKGEASTAIRFQQNILLCKVHTVPFPENSTPTFFTEA